MTPEQQIAAFMKKAVDITKWHIKDALSNLGERCTTMAREDHPNNWMDQSSNLRSSIGYAIIEDKHIEEDSGFPSVGGQEGKSGEEGSKAGKEYVKEIATECSGVFTLAVVAGMNYAAAVEVHRDVLAGAENFAKSKAADYIRIAHKRAANEINKGL